MKGIPIKRKRKKQSFSLWQKEDHRPICPFFFLSDRRCVRPPASPSPSPPQSLISNIQLVCIFVWHVLTASYGCLCCGLWMKSSLTSQFIPSSSDCIPFHFSVCCFHYLLYIFPQLPRCSSLLGFSLQFHPSLPSCCRNVRFPWDAVRYG